MHTKVDRLVASMAFALLAGHAVAQEDDREDILALMEQAFHAAASGIPEEMRAIQLAEGTSLSFRQAPTGLPGELLMRISTNERLLADDSGGGDKFLERWTGDPTVMIRGPIAVVWGEYEFWINGEFSHCGVDAADVVKIHGEWKIANWMWTVEKDNCETASSAVIN